VKIDGDPFAVFSAYENNYWYGIAQVFIIHNKLTKNHLWNGVEEMLVWL